VRLFRFSASTFYGHRIYVDLPQATGIEKHPSLVVHGPLQAILLMAAGRAARRAGADGAGADGAGADEVMPAIFRFRRLRPAFDTDPLTLAAGPLAGLTQLLMTATPQGAICTSAEMTRVS